jgi:hypothetical protein
MAKALFQSVSMMRCGIFLILPQRIFLKEQPGKALQIKSMGL